MEDGGHDIPAADLGPAARDMGDEGTTSDLDAFPTVSGSELTDDEATWATLAGDAPEGDDDG